MKGVCGDWLVSSGDGEEWTGCGAVEWRS